MLSALEATSSLNARLLRDLASRARDLLERIEGLENLRAERSTSGPPPQPGATSNLLDVQAPDDALEVINVAEAPALVAQAELVMQDSPFNGYILCNDLLMNILLRSAMGSDTLNKICRIVDERGTGKMNMEQLVKFLGLVSLAQTGRPLDISHCSINMPPPCLRGYMQPGGSVQWSMSMPSSRPGENREPAVPSDGAFSGEGNPDTPIVHQPIRDEVDPAFLWLVKRPLAPASSSRSERLRASCMTFKPDCQFDEWCSCSSCEECVTSSWTLCLCSRVIFERWTCCTENVKDLCFCAILECDSSTDPEDEICIVCGCVSNTLAVCCILTAGMFENCTTDCGAFFCRHRN